MNTEILNIISQLPTERQVEATNVIYGEILKSYYEGYDDGVSELKEAKVH